MLLIPTETSTEYELELGQNQLLIVTQQSFSYRNKKQKKREEGETKGGRGQFRALLQTADVNDPGGEFRLLHIEGCIAGVGLDIVRAQQPRVICDQPHSIQLKEQNTRRRKEERRERGTKCW